MIMFNHILTGFIGIISGITASYCFLKYYLNNRRPVIQIAENIAFYENSKDGKYYHFFKFVNMTDCDILDVRCELSFMQHVNSIKGQNLIGDDIKLNDDMFFHIHEKNKTDKNALHACRIYTKENLSELWENRDKSSYLSLKIIAKHSLTGLSSVFIQNYYGKQHIKKGEFEHGDGLKIELK